MAKTTAKPKLTFPKPEHLVRHEQAMKNPRVGFEGPIVHLFTALRDYADAHQQRYDSPIGEDGVLGPHWFDALKSFVGLLNGDVGPRLACGTLDAAARKLAKEHGFDGDEL